MSETLSPLIDLDGGNPATSVVSVQTLDTDALLAAQAYHSERRDLPTSARIWHQLNLELIDDELCARDAGKH